MKNRKTPKKAGPTTAQESNLKKIMEKQQRACKKARTQTSTKKRRKNTKKVTLGRQRILKKQQTMQKA